MTPGRHPPAPPGEAATEKLQKVLARAGLGSRRELEQWIADGRVVVNGRRAGLGDRVSPRDEIRVDGRPVEGPRVERARARVLRYHKPVGEVCTRRDPEGRPTVFETLPGNRSRRWIAVGRLDVNTSGLLLFTDSGELAHRLMHPSREVEREYAVRVYGEVPAEVLERLRTGVALDDGAGRFLSLHDAGGEGRNHWYRVVVREGRNRLVRRLWESQGVTVSRLARVRYGTVELPRRLRAGRWDELPAPEVATLLALAGMDVPAPAPARRRAPPNARRGGARPRSARPRRGD